MRPLHAKMLSLWRDDRVAHVVGSSNFTAAGIGLPDGGPVNIEANLIFTPREQRDAFDKACEAGVPPSDSVSSQVVPLKIAWRSSSPRAIVN